MSSLTLSAFPLVMTTYAVRVLLGALLLVVAMSASNTGPVYAATGDITTVAGTLIIGDGDVATNAFLKLPAGLATDGSGNVFIADTEQDRVRRVDAVTGIITTVAGTGERGFSGDGQAATGAQLAEPRGLAVDASNNLFIADASNGRIRKVDGVTKAISTIAGTGSIFDPFNEGALATSVGLQCVSDVAVDSAGDLLIADRCRHAIFKVDISAQTISTVAGTVNNRGFSGDGQAATAAKLKSAYGVAVDSDDNVYIADTGNDRIRKVDHVAKTIDTVAGSTPGLSGDNATPTAAQLNGPRGVAVDAFDNILIADTGNNRVRKVDFTAGLITTVAGTTFGFSGDSGPATSAKLKSVDAVAVNPAGDVFATDLFSDRVRRVDAATQIIDTFAGGKVPLSGDNGPAIDAEMNHPLGVALDKSGNLFIADDGNDRIRKVSANPGTITIFAGGGSTSGDGIPATDAMLSSAHDVAVHFDTGDVFIAELGPDKIRKVDGTTGLISTIAGGGSTLGDGGPATNAKLDCTKGLDVDRAGNVFIASACDARIRRVDALTGIITTVAGSGTFGFFGDGARMRARSSRSPMASRWTVSETCSSRTRTTPASAG